MRQQPISAIETHGGQSYHVPNRLNDAHCRFLNDNVGISRRTLRHVHVMFNETFGTALSWHGFMALRSDAIKDGRCKTTYIRNYFKHENSSERELRLQRPFLKSRLTGGCQFQPADNQAACGAPTLGRYCEKHVHAAYGEQDNDPRGKTYVDASLGKYG